jgi:2-keto-4-pentenoate hydratase/2-oxohepta-3-ene-1,7-dioic acid hydratase in catechol pathway
MRIASFIHRGIASFGPVTSEGIADAKALGFEDLLALLDRGDLAALARVEGPLIRADEVTLLPPIPQPRKILCAGVNYDAHRRETGRDPSEHPTLFVRFATSLVGAGEPIVRPRVSDRFDYEGELAVVIGRRCRNVSAASALDVIAGYACFNDGSVRDWQRHTSQFTAGKNFDRSGAFGPHLVTRDEIADPTRLSLETRLGGEVVQSASTHDMIFSVAELIAYVTSFVTLEPGDVIATGTPGGVGDKRTPPLYMRPGDRVEVSIEGVGVLTNDVVQET